MIIYFTWLVLLKILHITRSRRQTDYNGSTSICFIIKIESRQNIIKTELAFMYVFQKKLFVFWSDFSEVGKNFF
jgi:hypothetical protein